MHKDGRDKAPNYVIEGDPLRLLHQPSGLHVPLSSKDKGVVRAAQTRLKGMINAQ